MRGWIITVTLLAFGAANIGCGDSGPEISVGVNVRNLCQTPVSGEIETRCVDDSQCNGGFCWRPDPQACAGDDDCPGDDKVCTAGHCEQACTNDANCRVGFLCTCRQRGFCHFCHVNEDCADPETCDNGICHKKCLDQNQCAATEVCEDGWCQHQQTCLTDSDCGAAEKCENKQCHGSCLIDGDCAADEHCDGEPGEKACCNIQLCYEDCSADSECAAGEHCKEGVCTNSLCLKRGFCRNCQTDGNCGAGETCDHGWCHKSCSADGDCAVSEHCTGGVCRKPRIDGTEFNICNTGNKDLTVYLDQTKLYGQSDACAFANWSWAPAGQASVELGPDECSLNLRVEFSPSEIGDYHAFIEIYSNASNSNSMPIVLYGQAVEAACEESLDGSCEPACSFTEEDAQKLIDAKDDPGC